MNDNAFFSSPPLQCVISAVAIIASIINELTCSKILQNVHRLLIQKLCQNWFFDFFICLTFEKLNWYEAEGIMLQIEWFVRPKRLISRFLIIDMNWLIHYNICFNYTCKQIILKGGSKLGEIEEKADFPKFPSCFEIPAREMLGLSWMRGQEMLKLLRFVAHQ